jgi:hypothetical protein
MAFAMAKPSGNAADAAEKKRRAEEALLKRANAEIERMVVKAEAGDADAVERMATRIADITKEKTFPSQQRQVFLDRCKTLQRDAIQKSVDVQLDAALVEARTGSDEKKNKILAKAKEQYAKALRFQPTQEFKDGVKRKLETISMTSPVGTSEKAKTYADDGPAPKSKAPGGVERRRAIRFSDPVVFAAIEGVRYNTRNWSVRGLLIENYAGPLVVGNKVTILVSWEGTPQPGVSPAVVVRRDVEQKLLAVAFPDIDQAMLKLAHDMRQQGAAPNPE